MKESQKNSLSRAIELLELCEQCDLIYLECHVRGYGDWESKRTVADLVREFLKEHKDD